MGYVADLFGQILTIGSSIFTEGISLSIYLVCGILLVWIIGIIWVAKDSNERIDSIIIQIISIFLATLSGPIGVCLYKIFRPSNYILHKNIYSLLEKNTCTCKKCSTKNHLSHKHCEKCGKLLKNTCKECGNNISWNQNYCENCGAPNV